jgi:hypothetical protein
MKDNKKIVKYIIACDSIPGMNSRCYRTDNRSWAPNIDRADRYDLNEISLEYIINDKYIIIESTVELKVVAFDISRRDLCDESNTPIPTGKINRAGFDIGRVYADKYDDGTPEMESMFGELKSGEDNLTLSNIDDLEWSIATHTNCSDSDNPICYSCIIMDKTSNVLVWKDNKHYSSEANAVNALQRRYTDLVFDRKKKSIRKKTKEDLLSEDTIKNLNEDIRNRV